MKEALDIEVHGIVQGVGFRPWVYRLAAGEGLTGFVRNDASGVTIEAFGTAHKDQIVKALDDAGLHPQVGQAVI